MGLPPLATSRLFLLLGDPVEHSLSPLFQNAALRHRGIDAVYAVLRCDRQTVAPLMRALCRANGGGNITVPHKATAAECVERPSTAVRRTGVCNTFWGENGALHGDNTDVEGFRAAAHELLPSLEGARLLVLGAGGAAAAAVLAALDDGAAAIDVLNRSPDRAHSLAARLDPPAKTVRTVRSASETASRTYDLVVNATSLGLQSAALPFDLRACAGAGAVLDLTYGVDGTTPFVSHARSLGIPAADGTAMLIAQGAAAFRRWFGDEPPVDVMRAALRP